MKRSPLRGIYVGPPKSAEQKVAAAMRAEGSGEQGIGKYAAAAAPRQDKADQDKAAAPAADDRQLAQADTARARKEEDTADQFGAQSNWARDMILEVDRLRAALRQERQARAEMEEIAEDPAMRKLRRRIASDMAELLPLAKKQAMGGRPGLFRLITRAVGLRVGKK